MSKSEDNEDLINEITFTILDSEMDLVMEYASLKKIIEKVFDKDK